MIGSINLSHLSVKLFKPYANLEGVYYMPIDFNAFDNKSKIDSLKKQLKDVSNISVIDEYLVNCDGQSYLMYAYDDRTVNCFLPSMQKGMWLNSVDNDNGTIPVVVSNENYTLKLGQTQYIDMPGCENKIGFKIVGVMKDPDFYLNYNTASNVISTNDLFKYYNQKQFMLPMLFVNSSSMKQYEKYSAAQNISSILFFNNNIDEETKHDNINILSNSGCVCDLKDINVRGIDYANKMVRLYSPFFICGFAISLVGLIGLTVLSIVNNMRSFAVFYMLGCRWKNCEHICLGYIMIMLFISMLLLGVIYEFVEINYSIASLGIIINLYNILASVGVYLFSIIIALIVLKIAFYKNSAIKIFKECL